MSTTSTPLLFGGSIPVATVVDTHKSNTHARILPDLLYDGFFILFQLHNDQQPTSAEDFLSRVRAFLDDFDRGAKRLGVSAEDVFDAKYVFCTAVDETILSSNFAIRLAWERRSLQFVLFGEQLASGTSFVKFEELCAHSAPRPQALEVFYMCLLLGFHSRYIPEGPEKLAHLTARLGGEISAIKDKRVVFVPHWSLPDKVAHILKREAPLQTFGAVFVLIGLLGFLGLSHTLNTKTNETLEDYSQAIRLKLHFSHLAISLP